MTMRTSLVFLAIMAMVMRVATFRGKIGCDDQLTVYFDGTEVASDTVWNQVNDISVASRPAVIAAKCVNTGGPGGLIGSFNDGLVTDTAWRCSNTASAGWTGVLFDDSAWASAVESNYSPGLSDYGGVSPAAKFIWSDAGSAGTTYCRLNLGGDTFGGKIGCDDELTVFFDGTEVASDTVWNQVNDISVARRPAVIAAKCVNTGGPGGLIGSFDDGLVTDTAWRCSNTASAGWTGVSFDDSAWGSAVESKYSPGLSDYVGVSSSAKFIWSDAGSAGTTYCRLNLGGDGNDFDPYLKEDTFGGKIGCDDQLTVFFDGTEVASDTVWNQVNDISVARRPAVIAAKCVNTGGPGGLIGSFDDGLVTDTAWRCSNTAIAGWTGVSFDDSAWASAVESNYSPGLSDYVGVSSSAKFIWSDAGSAGTTYCRLNLGGDTFRGKIGCDDELTVYFDGTEVASDTVWNQVNDISVARRPAVIAAKCVNTGGPGGLVGSFDDGLVTDTAWRCSNTASAGWTGVSFDDSAWASAVESNNSPGLSNYVGVSSSAKFIWSDAGSAGTTYCRLNLGADV